MKTSSEEELEMEDIEDKEICCDTCDKYFYNRIAFASHMAEHQTCGIDGCTFNAHEKIITMHIKLQHSTGLYDKIRSFSTPEDIARWREARKKNYPTKENIVLRYKLQEEMSKRGERLVQSKRRFAENKKVSFNKSVKVKTKRRNKSKVAKQHNKTKGSLIDEKNDWNDGMFPFQGTNQLYILDNNIVDDISDDEVWSETTRKNEMKLKNALGDLMCAYGSSDNEEVEVASCSKIDENLLNKGGADCITNSSISKVPVESVIIENTKAKIKCKRKRPIKKNHQKEQTKVAAQFEKKYIKRRSTLLEKLLSKEILHERNVLLQCVRHVINKQFFDQTRRITNDGDNVLEQPSILNKVEMVNKNEENIDDFFNTEEAKLELGDTHLNILKD